MATDLFDVSCCPRGHRCESCGAVDEHLEVATADTPLGILCLTVCARCASARMAPPVSVSTANRLVLQHCQHLGITIEEMAEQLGDDR